VDVFDFKNEEPKQNRNLVLLLLPYFLLE